MPFLVIYLSKHVTLITFNFSHHSSVVSTFDLFSWMACLDICFNGLGIRDTCQAYLTIYKNGFPMLAALGSWPGTYQDNWNVTFVAFISCTDLSSANVLYFWCLILFRFCSSFVWNSLYWYLLFEQSLLFLLVTYLIFWICLPLEAVAVRERLESLCRELQRQNKMLMVHFPD